MKKVIFIMTLLAAVACKKESEPEINFWYIKLTAKFDTEIKGPAGRVLMFDLSNNFIDNYLLHNYYSSSDWHFFFFDVNNEPVLPFFDKELIIKKDPNTGVYINESTCMIGSDELPYNLADKTERKILLAIDLNGIPNIYTYKIINWGKENLELEKIFPSTVDDPVRHFIEW